MGIMAGGRRRLPARLPFRVSTKPVGIFEQSKTILIYNGETPRSLPRYAGILFAADRTPSRVPSGTTCLTTSSVDELSAWSDGDILLVEPSGAIRRVWTANSPHNALMVTYDCNCRCLMCPQPSERDPDGLLGLNLRILRLVKDQRVPSVGLTGGEPTLRLHNLAKLLLYLKRHFPQTSVILLSNGRAFHENNIVRTLASVQHPDVLYGIGLYSDTASVHDKMMGTPGSFWKTVRGLHNLALARQRVELRVVLSRINWERLPELAEFIYRNFPFVVHIAFMGLEITGVADENCERIWLEPTVYMKALRQAIRHLNQRDMRASIYNLPLCLLPPDLWRFARDSISGWKKIYLPQCRSCTVRSQCPGVFSTSTLQSQQIRPFSLSQRAEFAHYAQYP